MDRHERLPLGVVLERRRIDNPWAEFAWRPVAVFAGAQPLDPRGPWTELRRGEGWVHYHAGTLPLELFRKETEAYLLTLSQEPPRVFVVLRPAEAGSAAHEVVPFLVTASPEEAQEYLDGDADLVEPVTMPPEVIAFVRDFVEQHHVDVPFEKRKRKDRRGGPGRPGPRANTGEGHG